MSSEHRYRGVPVSFHVRGALGQDYSMESTWRPESLQQCAIAMKNPLGVFDAFLPSNLEQEYELSCGCFESDSACA